VPYSAHGKAFPNAEGHLVTSDDNGQTWNLVQTFRSPYTDDAGLAEPGFYAFPGGTQWSWFRTAYGNQYQSISHDGGKTWGPVIPNFCFTSPDSPMRVKKIHGCPHAVFNPQGFNCLLEDTENWRSPKRTPLVLAIGGENGEHFGLDGTTARNGGLLGFRENCYLLEEDRSNSYCYPCLQETRDGLLVSYYHSNGGNVCLNSTKITKVYREELEG
ncbi:MAG: exo-alpha-sialidase, partial [Clostridia bacterium]|nr:exo-alpha-sialidase [Clostridia bacterium]